MHEFNWIKLQTTNYFVFALLLLEFLYWEICGMEKLFISIYLTVMKIFMEIRLNLLNIHFLCDINEEICEVV